MGPDLILIVAGIAAAWAVLGVVGGERQVLLHNARALKQAKAAEDVENSNSVPTATGVPAPKKAA
jgi:hypothetical protein